MCDHGRVSKNPSQNTEFRNLWKFCVNQLTLYTLKFRLQYIYINHDLLQNDNNLNKLYYQGNVSNNPSRKSEF